MRERVVHRCDHGAVTEDRVSGTKKRAADGPGEYHEPVTIGGEDGDFFIGSSSGASTHRDDLFADILLTIEEDEEALRLATTIQSYFNALRTDARPSG